MAVATMVDGRFVMKDGVVCKSKRQLVLKDGSVYEGTLYSTHNP